MKHLIPSIRKKKLDTIDSLIEKCLEYERDRNLSARSLKELRIHFTNFVDFCQRKEVVFAKDLSTTVFRSFAEYMGKKDRPGQAKAAMWTIRKFGAYLALFQFLPMNPAAHIPHPKMSPRSKLPEYLRPDELSLFLKTAVDTRPIRDITVVSLLATTGFRSQEVASLCLKDVDLKRKIIKVTVKGGWVRITPISTVMAEILEAYMQNTSFPGQSLFYNNWGSPINNTWVLRLVKSVGKDAGIKRTVTPRVMRHTFATYMAERHGKQITKMFLGHSANRSTDVYMHLIPGKFREYANKHSYKRLKKRGKK